MDSVVHAFNVVLSIFVMIGAGMLLTGIGWINREISGFISKFVIRVALPATIVANMFGKFTAESLVGMAAGLIVPVLGLSISIFLALFTARLIGLERRRRGVFVVMFVFSNAVFIGLPVCTALFGEAAIPHTLLYYIANTSLFWTVGYTLMQRDGVLPREERSYRLIPAYLLSRDKTDARFIPARNALKILAKTIPLPLVTLIISAILILLHVNLPAFLMSSASYLGNTVTPISLIYIGYLLMRMIRERNFRWEKSYSAVIIGKFLVVPAVTIALIKLFSLNSAMRALWTPTMVGAIVMQAAMPVMTQTAIVAGSVGADDEYAAGATALTTALSLLFIPIYMYIITTIL